MDRKRANARRSRFRIGLAVLAVLSDVVGVTTGSSTVQLTLGCVTLLAGLAMVVHYRKLTWIPNVKIVARIVTAVAVVVIAFGSFGAISDRRTNQRAALADTCAKAQDLREAFFAKAQQVAIGGILPDSPEPVDEGLTRLTVAANASGSSEAKAIVHDIRNSGAIALGFQDKNELVPMMAATIKMWEEFRRLVGLCRQAGLEFAYVGKLAIAPTVADACRLFGEFVLRLNQVAGPSTPLEADGSRIADAEGEELMSILNQFAYHAINANDEKLGKELRDLASWLSPSEGSPDFADAIIDDCRSRGYAMPSFE